MMKKNMLFRNGVVCAIFVLFINIITMPLAGSLSIEHASTKGQICKTNLANDTTPPDIELTWEAFKEGHTWYVKFTVLCNDTSGIDRVEFGIQFLTQYIDYEPPYEWTIQWCNAILPPEWFFCFTAFDKAGNSAFVTVKFSEMIFPVMVVHIYEIYGTVDDPQYRPLDNVTVEINHSFLGLIWFSYWSGITDKCGTTEQVAIPDRDGSGEIWIFPPTKYKITVSKDGYHTYGCLSFKIVKKPNQGRCDVNFAMAKDGSPFVKQISQQSASMPSSQNVMGVVSSISTNVEMKASMPTNRGNILYVGGSGPGNYSKIQDAINDSKEGDTVFVYDDSSPYYENIIISCPYQHRAINLIGEDKNTTIIDGSNNVWVVAIGMPYVTLTGFTIQNSKHFGIYIDGTDYTGMSDDNTIYGNIIRNTGNGIILEGSKNNKIYWNNITNNDNGISIQGFYQAPSNNEIYQNNIMNNNYGIYLTCGLDAGVSDNRIYQNNIINNKIGVWIRGVENNYIYQNNITNNSKGVLISTSIFYSSKADNNKIYQNNFIGNTFYNARDWCKNQWDNGTIGNYWDNYIGLKFPRLFDLNNDGIGGLFYIIRPFFKGNKDRFPMMEPYDIGV